MQKSGLVWLLLAASLKRCSFEYRKWRGVDVGAALAQHWHGVGAALTSGAVGRLRLS